MLVSPAMKTLVDAEIQYDDDEDIVNPFSEINIVYNNTEYVGNGTDYLLTDTFADLQSKLPPDVKLACCMTCCYGNMCPYGNEINNLFCLKDKIITDKKDVCKIFDRNDAFEKYEVFSYGYCDDFVYQSNKFYTYNDYSYYLHKKK